MWSVVRQAARSAFRPWSFASAVVLTIALSAGATAAAWTVFRGVLLAPLALPDPDRLVTIGEQYPGVPLGPHGGVLSNVAWHLWTGAGSSSIGPIALYRTSEHTVSTRLGTSRAQGTEASPEIGDVLGATPTVGRWFSRSGSGAPERELVLCHRFWREHFAGDASAIGRTVHVDGIPYLVVGVAGPAVTFPADDVQFWIPLDVRAEEGTGVSPNVIVLSAVARLRPGATAGRAASEGTAVVGRIAASGGSASLGLRTAFGAAGAPIIRVTPLKDAMTEGVRPALVLIVGAVLAVYLIACANLTSLFVARGTTRRRELAVRRSIGATSAQLFRMFVAESIVLALPGAALGLVVARWLVVFVQGSAPLDIPRLVSVEQGSLIVGLGVALVGALACGLLGLAGVVATDGYADASELGPRAGTLSKRTRRAHRALLGIEAACASVVLVATVLLGASLARLLAVDPGYTSQGVVVLRVYISGDDDDTEARRWRLTQELLRELRVLPSVVSAGAGTMFPFDSGNAMAGFPLPGQYRVALPPDVTPRSAFARTYSVTPGYAEALRLRVLNGRLLTERDRTADVERWVVSKEFARLYLPANPVGRRFPWTVADRDVDLEIVGVVDDVLKDGLDRSAQPELYDLMRDGRAGDIKLVIRAAARADALVGSVRALASRLAPDAAIDVTALDELKAHSVSGPRFLIVVVGVFAALALVLACGGVYAVTTFSVSQRRRELAIRGALGAPAAALAWLVMRQALEPTAAGLCAGLACATTLARLGQDHLFRTSPLEPFAFGATAVSVASVTLLAATIPALSAARSEPTLALRSE